MNSIDNEYNFSLSYPEIMEKINISKPTLIKLFKDLQDKNLITKLPKRKYKININNINYLFENPS